MIEGEAWGPVLGVQASEGHIVIGEGSKRGGRQVGVNLSRSYPTSSKLFVLIILRVEKLYHLFETVKMIFVEILLINSNVDPSVSCNSLSVFTP